ncbi:Protein PBDC1 [Gonioctena quinquepunctata]|nr:Protein PBDC1 [Gonioctena quinquepunctata]
MDVLSRPAEEFGNDQSIETMWAIKAFEHAEIYFNILCSVDPKDLKLTPLDDLIYKLFREEFPNLDITVLIENELKSTKEKAKWRPFCERFKTLVEDYSYGTLLRADAKEDYKEENTILVTRIQFLAIEIARNREGVNDILRKKFTPAVDQRDKNEETQS